MALLEEENAQLKARIAVLERDLEACKRVIAASPVGTTTGSSERALTSEARHRQIVELVREGIAVTDAEGRWAFTNRRVEEMLGHEPGGMLGKHVVEVLGAEGRARLEERRRQGLHEVAEAGEMRLVRRDGREIWVQLDSSPIVGEAGHHAGSILVISDLTERRSAEERMRRSEEQLLAAQAIAGIGTWAWDLRDGSITRSAELCRILGETEEGFGSTKGRAGARVHPDDRARVQAEVMQALASQPRHEFDCRIIRPDGVGYMHIQAVIVRDAAGAAIRTYGTAQDVTEKKHVEARLRLADRMMSVGTLAAGVAHEINNPLAYILSNLDLAAEEIREISGDAPSERLRELGTLIAEARQGGERVRKIVGGLRTFSRADEERRVILDVKQVLDVAAAMANNEIRHRARLVREVGEVLFVEADEARLSQVFVNLLVNAAQAIPEGNAEANEIRVVTRKDAAGRVVVEVHDTGCGMSREVLARAFDPFFTTRPIGVGTGLGLSICHGIITALGGEITAQSEPGTGSVFQVALPAAQPIAAPPEATDPGARPAGRRGRVLVVDDDAMVARTLSRVLKDHDVTVLTSAREARDRLVQGERFDLILCDLMMPEMTGMELHAALIRAIPEVAERMVFLTGGAFTPTAMEFLDRVPNERIDKPFDPGAIRALAQRALR